MIASGGGACGAERTAGEEDGSGFPGGGVEGGTTQGNDAGGMGGEEDSGPAEPEDCEEKLCRLVPHEK